VTGVGRRLPVATLIFNTDAQVHDPENVLRGRCVIADVEVHFSCHRQLPLPTKTPLEATGRLFITCPPFSRVLRSAALSADGFSLSNACN
jgi:hypothetical protein